MPNVAGIPHHLEEDGPKPPKNQTTMTNNLPTVEELQTKGLDIYKTLEYIYSLRPNRPQKLTKPFLPTKHTSSDVIEYAEKLKEFESLKNSYEEQLNNRNREIQIDGLIQEYIIAESGLNQYVPEQYRLKVYQHAYNEGHSDGHYEVYNKLIELMKIFE